MVHNEKNNISCADDPNVTHQSRLEVAEYQQHLHYGFRAWHLYGVVVRLAGSRYLARSSNVFAEVKYLTMEFAVGISRILSQAVTRWTEDVRRVIVEEVYLIHVVLAVSAIEVLS